MQATRHLKKQLAIVTLACIATHAQATSTQGLNRDITNTEKTLYDYSQSQNIEATLDGRLLTQDGRKQIKNDIDTIINAVKESVIYREAKVAFSQLVNNLDADGEAVAGTVFENPEKALNSLIAEGIRSGEYNANEAMAVLSNPQSMAMLSSLVNILTDESDLTRTPDATSASGSNTIILKGEITPVHNLTDSKRIELLQLSGQAQQSIAQLSAELGVDPGTVTKVVSYTALMATGRGPQIVYNEIIERVTGEAIADASSAVGIQLTAGAHGTDTQTIQSITSGEFATNAPAGEEDYYQALADHIAQSQQGAEFLSEILLGSVVPSADGKGRNTRARANDGHTTSTSGNNANTTGQYLDNFEPSPTPTQLIQNANGQTYTANIRYDHVLDGNINGLGVGSGGHYIRSDNVRITKITGEADANGVIRAQTQIRDPKTGGWIDKPNPTTLYPEYWTKRQTIKEIEGAFQNSKPIPNDIPGRPPKLWEGTSPSGVKIQGYYTKPEGGAATAWPVYQGGK